jgi:hypothetical protein
MVTTDQLAPLLFWTNCPTPSFEFQTRGYKEHFNYYPSLLFYLKKKDCSTINGKRRHNFVKGFKRELVKKEFLCKKRVGLFMYRWLCGQDQTAGPISSNMLISSIIYSIHFPLSANRNREKTSQLTKFCSYQCFFYLIHYGQFALANAPFGKSSNSKQWKSYF